MEGVEHQQRVLEFASGLLAQFLVIQQANQRFDIVPSVHIAEQGNCPTAVYKRAFGFPFDDCREITCFDVSGLINPGWYARCNKVEQKLLFSSRWFLKKFYQPRCLFSAERFWWNVLCGPFGHVFTIRV